MSILSFFNSFKVKILFQVSSEAKKLFKVSLDLGHEGRGKNKKKYQSVLFGCNRNRKERKYDEKKWERIVYFEATFL